MLIVKKDRSGNRKKDSGSTAGTTVTYRQRKQAEAVHLVRAMLSRYPTGELCTHDAGSQGPDPDRVCFCAYGFPPDMDAESTGEMNGIISAYNRRCGLDMPLLRPPADG